MKKSKFALLGEKIGHSYSPIIHNRFFEMHNINASYELYPCPESDLKKAIDSIRNGEYEGMNVTIPYKIKVMDYLDEISEEAKRIGSVNTIVKRDNKLIGYNTDYYGFLDTLIYNSINVKEKKVFILGSGGAMLAVKAVLEDLGAQCNVVSRKGQYTYSMLEKETPYLIVNTTPVGMFPNTLEMPISIDLKNKTKYIVDLIYNPLCTKLIMDRQNAYNGLYMLVVQAVKSLELWLNESISDKIELYDYLKEMIK